MEIPPRQISSYLKSPNPGHRVILLFGGNEGLIRERARAVAGTFCPDLDDPFQIVRLSGNDLREDPARLADEFGALSMTGGRRIIFLSQPNVQTLNALKTVLSDDLAGDALIIVEAPDVAKSTALARLIIKSPLSAAMGCYPDDQQSILGLVEDVLSGAGLSVTPDGMASLAFLLGEDRAQIRQRLDMLVLYKGDDRSPVTLEEITVLFESSPTQALHTLIDHIFSNNINNLQLYISICRSDGYGPSMIIRTLAAHAGLLRLLQEKRQTGADWNSLFRTLRPPVHFKRQAACRRAAETWSAKALQNCQSLLLEAEHKCRLQASLESVIAERAIMAASKLTR